MHLGRSQTTVQYRLLIVMVEKYFFIMFELLFMAPVLRIGTCTWTEPRDVHVLNHVISICHSMRISNDVYVSYVGRRAILYTDHRQ